MSKAINAANLHKSPVISRNPANQVGKSPENGSMKGLFGENLQSIPTNRIKYDDKPMPPLPDPSPVRPTRGRSDHRFYIHPATPYRKTPVNLSHVKDRAATDPVIPKPLFASKEKVKTQPREETVEPNYHQEVHNDVDSFQKRPSVPPSTVVPSKASAVLGFYPVLSKKVINEIPSSAPPSTTPPDHYRSSEETSSCSPSPPRQVQSTPVPTRPYVRGNAILTPTLTHSSRASSRQIGDTESDGGPVQGIITGDGLLSPTRTGGYGKLGGATYVDQIDMQRVDSQVGIIETVHSPAPTEKSSCSHHHNDDYNINFPQPSHETMRYTQGNYAGVWENDPHVGYSLPPFSPNPTQYQAQFMPPHSNMYAPNESYTTCPKKQGLNPAHLPPPHPCNRAGSYQYSRHSATVPASPDEIFRGNSHPYSVARPYDSRGMPAHSRGNSYTSSNTFASGNTQSGASLSGSANPGRKYAYQVPPYHQIGLQPPPVQAGLAHMELTLHHRIENSFASLIRLVTDKHDMTVNQVVLRLETLEERLERRSKKVEADLEEIKGDLEEMKKELISRQEELSKECLKGFNSVRELVRGVDYKMGSLEKKVEECSYTSQYRCGNGELSGGRIEFDLSPRRPNQSPKHRRTESAQATFPAQEPSPVRSLPLGSHATSAARKQSRSSGDGKSDYSSSQGRHSNSTSTSARSSNDRSASRREFFADLVATRGQQPPPPDLSQHPAYNQSQPSNGRPRPPTPIPSLPSPPFWSSQNSKGGSAKSPTTLLFHKPSSRHLDWYQKAFA